MSSKDCVSPARERADARYRCQRDQIFALARARPSVHERRKPRRAQRANYPSAHGLAERGDDAILRGRLVLAHQSMLVFVLHVAAWSSGMILA